MVRVANKRDQRKVDNLFPSAIQQDLRRAFTLKGMDFFKFYAVLKSIELKLTPPMEDMRGEYKRATARLAQVNSPYDDRPLTPTVINMLSQSRTDMSRWLRRLEQSRMEDPTTWRRINEIMVPLIQEVARDKGVYIKPRTQGQEQWAIFRAMTPRQVALVKLADEDPESYALMMQRQQTLEEIDAGIKKSIEDYGMVRERGFFMGRPVQWGIDPNTDERFIFDRDGEVLTSDEYKQRRLDQEEAKERLARVPTKTEVPPEDLRRLPDSFIDKMEGASGWVSITDDGAKQGRLTRLFQVKHHEVLENDATSGDTVRRGYKVVVSGRYKGVYLDDLINSQGRLIEGTAYTYSEKTGRPGGVPVRIDPSEREPYVTSAEVVTRRGKRVIKETKLYIKIGGDHKFAEAREALKSLSSNTGTLRGSIPSVTWASQANLHLKTEALLKAAKEANDLGAIRSAESALKRIEGGEEVPQKQKQILSRYFKTHKIAGSREASFYFEPKDFAAIRDRLQGMSLSKSALAQIQTYFKDIARAEAATVKENLGHYSLPELGGFISSRKNPRTGNMDPVDLTGKQKQGVAWLDANGNKGVLALDTGVGKSLSAVAVMGKLIRDGLTEPGASYVGEDGKEVVTNGRFLFVCPPALRGNMPKEIRQFVSDPASMRDRLDVISYREFSGSSRSKKAPRSIRNVPAWKGRSWDPALYVAVVFDEAHELAKPGTSKSKAAQDLKHPRKILMTASPMEKTPMEAYVLAAIANNKPLTGSSDEARKNRAEMRRFKERFCETLGGRIIGLKQDPEDPGLNQDLMTWIKSNIFYADKTDVEEIVLPSLKQGTSVAQMSPEVESLYRDITGAFSGTMKGLVAKFRDRGGDTGTETRQRASDPTLERVFGRAFAPIFQTLNGLANYPQDTIMEIARLLETETILDSKGQPQPIPPNMRKMVAAWKRTHTPESLREIAARAGNPKMDMASETLRTKARKTEGASRTLLFSDDKKLCLISGKRMSEDMPGYHAVCLNDKIHLFRGGSEVKTYTVYMDRELVRGLVKDEAEQKRILSASRGMTVHDLPFRSKSYRAHPALPVHPKYNTHYKTSDWQTFVLKEILSTDTEVRTCTLLGQVYQTGQNLQAFDTVVHLDRDTFNDQDMQQRTARAWRQGQDKPVEEVTIDAVFSEAPDGEPRDEFDATLDEIKKWYQEMEGDLFDAIIKKAQTTALGSEWAEMTHRGATNYRLNNEVMNLALSPYASRSLPQ